MTLLAFPYASGLGCLRCQLLRSLQSRLPFVVSPPFHVSVCPSPALGLGWFWSQVCGPTCSYCVLGYSWVSVAPFCHLSRTLSLCFLAWVFFLGRLLGLGLVGCGPARVPTFWGNSPSLVLVFAGRFLPFGCPGFWCFPGIFTWVLSSRFQCLLMAWGGYG